MTEIGCIRGRQLGAADLELIRACQPCCAPGSCLKPHGPEPDETFTTCVHTLRTRAHALQDAPRAAPAKEKVRLRLWKQRDHRFTFLEKLAVPAANNPAARQLRPAVIARERVARKRAWERG